MASLTNARFDIQGAYLDIDCGAFDWACDEVTDLLVDRATGILEDAAAAAITDMVPPLLEETLESVELSPVLELPAPVDASLGVNAILDRLAFCGPDVGLPVPAANSTSYRLSGSFWCSTVRVFSLSQSAASLPARPSSP